MNVKQDLRFVCDEMTSTLRYAESKHSIFVAFNGLAIFSAMGILRSLFSEKDPHMACLLGFTMLFLMLAICTSMLSFFPQIIGEKLLESEQQNKTNILFFGHAKVHTMDSYIEVLCTKYGANLQDIGQFERGIISQIIVNAQLISRKFRLFKIAVIFDLLAVIVGLGGFLMKVLLA